MDWLRFIRLVAVILMFAKFHDIWTVPDFIITCNTKPDKYHNDSSNPLFNPWQYQRGPYFVPWGVFDRYSWRDYITTTNQEFYGRGFHNITNINQN